MTVLVTGATGLVGRHLVQRLLSEGARVRALVRPTADASPLAAAGVEIATADLANDTPLDAVVAGCDVVHHLAAVHGPGIEAAACEAVNVGGTERLARAAARAGVRRFVLASTRGVHGLVRGGILSEQSPVAPNTPYRHSKLEGERVVARCASQHGLRAVTLRLPSMIGSGSRTWLELFRTVARGRFRLIGRGSNRMHPCHVADAADALSLAAAAPGVEGETFIIGGAAPLSQREFLQHIAIALGVGLARVPMPLAPYRALLAVRRSAARSAGRPLRPDAGEFWLSSYEIDDRKARQQLGYVPRGSLQEAVDQTVSWYRRRGVL